MFLRGVRARLTRYFKMETGDHFEGAVIHCSAPISGKARDVVAAALSGEYMDTTFVRPKSFELLHESSLKKIAAKDNQSRLEDQRKRLEKSLAENGPIDVDFLFKIGSLYRHVLNKAGVAVAERLTENHKDDFIEEGYYLRCYLKPKLFDFEELRRSDVIYEHEDFIAIDKPSGMPSVATADNYVQNACVVTAKLIGCDQLWPVHRLDFPTTGVLVLAKSSEACGELQNVWRNRAVDKYYSLIAEQDPTISRETVEPLPPVGTTITHWMLGKDTDSPKQISLEEDERFSKRAALVLESCSPVSSTAEDQTDSTSMLCQVKLLVSWLLKN